MSLFDTVYFPYGAYGSAGYTKAKPHQGNDFKADEGTPVIVQGTQIGLVGQTGKADGPHVHVQAGRDGDAQITIDSLPYVDRPGTVVRTGFASQWGNFVCIKVDDVYVYYCHLSRIDVQVGQEVGGQVKANLRTGQILAEVMSGYLTSYTGKDDDVIQRDYEIDLTNEQIQRLYSNDTAVAFRNYRNNLITFWNDWHDKIAKGNFAPDDQTFQEALVKVNEAKAALEAGLSK